MSRFPGSLPFLSPSCPLPNTHAPKPCLPRFGTRENCAPLHPTLFYLISLFLSFSPRLSFSSRSSLCPNYSAISQKPVPPTPLHPLRLRTRQTAPLHRRAARQPRRNHRSRSRSHKLRTFPRFRMEVTTRYSPRPPPRLSPQHTRIRSSPTSRNPLPPPMAKPRSSARSCPRSRKKLSPPFTAPCASPSALKSIPSAGSPTPSFLRPAPATISRNAPWPPPVSGNSPRPNPTATASPASGSFASNSPLPAPELTQPRPLP